MEKTKILGRTIIFSMLSNKNYPVPVLTAEHGMGEWEPSVLYDLLEDFIKNIK